MIKNTALSFAVVGLLGFVNGERLLQDAPADAPAPSAPSASSSSSSTNTTPTTTGADGKEYPTFPCDFWVGMTYYNFKGMMNPGSNYK